MTRIAPSGAILVLFVEIAANRPAGMQKLEKHDLTGQQNASGPGLPDPHGTSPVRGSANSPEGGWRSGS
jgi:hypothetical protein